ncbi:hypothetical protein BmR1_04g05500 [Babesia microti strain RI]|uniref:Uncharacterized protein n=1 Tax=Babesia microti (strain RI) TaxID=1133968 RepID=I7J8B4_BABMR|nr:hypothetical protein BmR1_04g05500 [Babesia microti strain RI]CCF75298.1 hypothetical protein BmR1_04g05500 [Babesia microti strain RI]|eukprot:XP_012649706.1 hypothetical protein BmR1_04g05500 [Babesia microti strain RI]
MENSNTYKLIIQSPSTWKITRDGKSESIKKVYGLVFERVTKLVVTGSFPLEIPRIVLDSDELDHHILAVWFFDDYISVSSLKTAIINEVKNNNSVLDSPLVIDILKKSIGTIYIPATSLSQSIKLVKKSTATNIPENLTNIFPKHSILKFRIAIEQNYFPLSSIDNLENYFKDSVQKKRIGVNRAGFHFFDVDDDVDNVSNVPLIYSHCPSEKNYGSKHLFLEEEDDDSLYSRIESCLSKSSLRKSKSSGSRNFSKSYVPGMYNNLNSNDSYYPASNGTDLYDKSNPFDLSYKDSPIMNIEKYKRSDTSPKSNLSKSAYDIDSAIRDFKKQNKLAQEVAAAKSLNRSCDRMLVLDHTKDYGKKLKEPPLEYYNRDKSNPLTYSDNHTGKLDFPQSNLSSYKSHHRYESEYSLTSPFEMTKKKVTIDEFSELNNKFKSLLGRFFNMAFKFSKCKAASLEIEEKNRRYIIAKFKYLVQYLNLKRKLETSRIACRKLAKSILFEKAKNVKSINKHSADLLNKLNNRIKDLEEENKALMKQNKDLQETITSAEEEHNIQLSEITMQIEKTTEDFYLQKTIIQELQKRLDNDTKGEELKALKANEAELKSQIKALTSKNVELTDENTLLACKLKHAESLKTSELDRKLTKIGDFLSKHMQSNSYHFVKDRITDSYKRYSLYSNSLINKPIMMGHEGKPEPINNTKLLTSEAIGNELIDDLMMNSPSSISPQSISANISGPLCHIPTKTRLTQPYSPTKTVSLIKSMSSSLGHQSQKNYNAVNINRFGTRAYK